MHMIIANLKSKKLVLILGLFIVIILGIFLSFGLGKKFTLSINAYPEGALIEVDELYKQESLFTKKIKKGLHKVVITKEGYEKKEKEVVLDKDTDLSFSLEPL